MEATLAGLGNRVFLMNNVHDDEPVVFQTRWAMSLPLRPADARSDQDADGPGAGVNTPQSASGQQRPAKS